MADTKQNKEDIKSYEAIRKEKENLLDLEKQILTVKKALSKFSKDELETNKNAIALSKTAQTLYEKREESIGRIKKNRETLKNLDRDELNALTLKERYAKKQLESSQKQLNIQKERKTLSEKELDQISDIKDKHEDLYDLGKRIIGDLKLRKDQQESINGLIDLSAGLSLSAANAIRTGDENAQDFAKTVATAASAISSQVELTRQQDEAQKSALKGEFKMLDTITAERKIRDLKNKLISEDVTLTIQQREELEQVLKALDENLDKTKALNSVNAELVKKTKEMAAAQELGKKAIGPLFDKMKSSIEKIPGGSLLTKLFKFDDIQASVEKKLGGAFNGLFEKIGGATNKFFGKFKSKTGVASGDLTKMTSAGTEGMGGLGQGAEIAMEGASMGARGFGATLATATAGVTLIIAGVMELVKLFLEADKEVAEMGRELGISKKEAIGVYNTAADIAAEMNIVGINAKEIGKAIKDVGTSLGGIDVSGQFKAGNKEIQQMVKDSAIMTEKFGMSAEEVDNMHGLAAITGKSVGQLAMTATTLGKGVFTAKESMKIMASIPKTVAIGMKGNVEAMTKMAQQAKLLGLDLKKVEEIGQGTLEIEDSLGKEMEARVLTGKNINLDTMRAAALHGDTATVMKELVKNAGDYDEFSKMGPVKQKALAAAMGMTREEMTDMLLQQKKLSDAGISYEKAQEAQNANAEKLADMIAHASTEEEKAYLENIQKQQQSEDLSKNFASLMEKIKGLAVQIVTPIMEMVDGLMAGSEGGKGILDSLKPIFHTLGIIVKALMPYFSILFEGVALTLGGIAKLLSGDIMGGLKDIFIGLVKWISPLGNLLMGLLFKFVKYLGTVFMDAIKSAGNSILEWLSQPFIWIGEKIDSIISYFTVTLPNAVKDFGAHIIEYVLGPLKGAWDTVSDIGGKLMDAPGKALDTVGGWLGLADGGDVKKGGLTVVGEKGPEIASLPGGSTVASTDASNQIAKILKSFGISQSGGDKSAGGGAGDQAGSILKVLGLGGMSGGTGSGGESDKKENPFDAMVRLLTIISEMVTKSTTILDYFVNGKKDEDSPLKLMVKSLMDVSKNLDEFIHGKEIIDEKTGKKTGKRESTVFDNIIEQIMTSNTILSDIKIGIMNLVDAVMAGLDPYQKQSLTLRDYGSTKKEEEKSTASDFFETVTGIKIKPIPNLGEPGQLDKTNTPSGSNEQNIGSNLFTTGGDTNMSNVEKKLDTLISLFSQAASQPTVIRFGDKVVDEIKTQLNFKKAYNINVDNTYGRRLQN